ncbi:hypothetical protein AAMO2058_000021000 [Amorphochlora amoebiformis]
MGSFAGHAIPGAFLLFFGLAYTIQAFLQQKKRKGNRQRSTEGPADHIAFPHGLDYVFLERSSLIVGSIFASFIGLIIEWPNLIPSVSTNLETGLVHMSLYGGYFVWSTATLAQRSFSLAPPGSITVLLAVVNTLVGLGWSSHADMKEDMVDELMHKLLSYICYFAAFSAIATLFQKHSIAVFSTLFATALHGLWLIGISFLLFDATKPINNQQKPVEHYQVIVSFNAIVYILLSIFLIGYNIVHRQRKFTNTLSLSVLEEVELKDAEHADDTPDDMFNGNLSEA